MALVTYDYSGSESDVDSDIEKDHDHDHEHSYICVLFHTLPQPKQPVVIEEEEDDILLKKSVPKKDKATEPVKIEIPKQVVTEEGEDDILLKKNVPKKTSVKEPVKIAIPALSNYNSDEEEPPKKIINKPSAVKATGLFSILPSPKCTPVERNSKFDANVVKQKNLVPRTVTAKAATAKRQHDSDDEDAPSSNFFSLTDTKKVNAGPVAVSSTLNMQIDSAKPVKDMNSKSNAFFSDLVANAAKTDVPENPVEEETDTLEKNAVEELCGKRKKKAKKNDVNFIDINAADVMPDPREWRTKALTEEAPSAAVKKGEEPSLQSRKKHQITYLAYQAKVNEQELKNQWAMNRMTRKQTQAKYGF